MTSNPTQPAAPPTDCHWTFTQLVAIAWRHLKTYWRQLLPYAALAYGGTLVAGLVVLPLMGALTAIFGLSSAWQNLILLAVLGVVMSLLMQGYLWTIVCSFDGGHTAKADFRRPLRRPWLLPMLLLCGVDLLTAAAFESPLLAAPPEEGFRPWLWLARTFFTGFTMVATLLVGPIILAAAQPRFVRAFRDYFGLLRAQPRLILLAVAATMMVDIVVTLPSELFLRYPTPDPSQPLGFREYLDLALMLAYLIFFTLYAFVVAVVFRAATGQSLDIRAATVTTTKSPSGAGGFNGNGKETD